MQPVTPGELRDALAQMLFTSGAVIYSVDAAGCVETWNFAAEELLGYAKAEVVGKPVTTLAPEEEWPELQVLQSRARQGEVVRSRCRRRHRLGHWVEVEMKLAPIETRERAFRGYCVVLFNAPDADLARREDARLALLAADQRAARRLAQRLHDDLHQQLLGAAFACKALSNRAAGPVTEELATLAEILKTTVVKTRDFAAELNFSDFDGPRLVEALQRICDQVPARLGCRLESIPPPKIGGKTAGALLRAAEEAITNAAQHALGSHIAVRIAPHESWIKIEVRDDGCGFDAGGPARNGLGLTLMRSYVEIVDGRCEISSAAGRGTVVTIVAPLRES